MSPAEIVAESRRQQGLPAKVVDPVVLADLAALVAVKSRQEVTRVAPRA